MCKRRVPPAAENAVRGDRTGLLEMENAGLEGVLFYLRIDNGKEIHPQASRGPKNNPASETAGGLPCRFREKHGWCTRAY